MTFKVEVSNQAETDLRGIFEYIAFKLQSPESAIGQLDRLEKAILSLDFQPERFRLYDNEPWRSRGLHIMPVDNFVVLYVVDRDNNTVGIVRVMYGKRDIDAQLETK